VSAGIFLPLFRGIGIVGVLRGLIALLVALFMSALSRESPFFCLPVIERWCGQCDIEIAGRQVVRARIKFLALQSVFQTLNGIMRQGLDGQQRCRGQVAFARFCSSRARASSMRTMPRDAGPPSPPSAEGSKADNLAGAVEQRSAGISRIDVYVGNDGVRLDLADDAGGNNFVEGEGGCRW